MRSVVVLLALLRTGTLAAQTDSLLLSDPRVLRISKLEEKGRHEAACKAYDELAADTAMRALTLRLKADCLGMHQSKPVEALASYDAAIAWHPRDPAGYNERGLYCMELNMPSKAVADFRRTVELSSDTAYRVKIMANLSSAHAYMRQWKESLAVLDEARALDSTDIGVLVNRSLALDELGRTEEGLAELMKAYELEPRNSTVLNNLGYHHTRLNEHKASVRWYREALEAEPNSPYAMNNLGYAELRAGNSDAALALVQRSIQLDPSNSYAFRNLGHVWKEKGDLTKACEAYERALDLGFTMRYGPEVKQMKDTYCR